MFLALTLTQTSRGLHLGRCESSGRPHSAFRLVTYVGRPHAIVATMRDVILQNELKLFLNNTAMNSNQNECDVVIAIIFHIATQFRFFY